MVSILSLLTGCPVVQMISKFFLTTFHLNVYPAVSPLKNNPGLIPKHKAMTSLGFFQGAKC